MMFDLEVNKIGLNHLLVSATNREKVTGIATYFSKKTG